MNLYNILNNKYRKLLIAISLLMSSLPVQASVIYNFTSAPISVGEEQLGTGERVVQDEPGLFGLQEIGRSQTASLTFASPLAPNLTNFPLYAESGGSNFIGGPNQGGLEAYLAPGFFPKPITSDINVYLEGSGGTVLLFDRYSSLTGEVTTDASGNIVAWDLAFNLYFDSADGAFTLDTATNVFNEFGSRNIAALLDISSDPALPQTIGNVVQINGVPQPEGSTYNFNEADTAFTEGFLSDTQFRYYTSQLGSFAPVNQLSTPSTLPLLGTALLSWGFIVHRQRQSRFKGC
jgi:hypothetical protein